MSDHLNDFSSQTEESNNEKNIHKADLEGSINIFKIFEKDDIESGVGGFDINYDQASEKKWDYIPNNFYNHTIEDLKKIVNELKKPLLDMVEGRVKLDTDVFSQNTQLIKDLNWFIENEKLHKNINKELYYENLLNNEILDYSREQKIINQKIATLKDKLKLLQEELLNLEKEHDNLSINESSVRKKHDFLKQYIGIDSNPVSIIPKCIVLSLIESKVEEIEKFKVTCPLGLHGMLDELIQINQNVDE